MSTLLKPLCGALIIACGALVLTTDTSPLVTPALAQAALAQTEPAPLQPQPEKLDHPRPRAGDPTTTPAPPPPLSPEISAQRSKLDASKLDLDQKEAALNRRDLSDAELQGLRQGIDPITESLRTLIGNLAPKLEAAKARLDQIGPKPKEDDPDESPDVAGDRTERESAVAELDETQRLTRAVLIQAEQLIRAPGDGLGLRIPGLLSSG